MSLKATTPPLPYEGEFEVSSLINLLTDTDVASADDRRLAIEMQVDHRVPLDPGTVLAIVLPKELLQATYIKEFLAGSGAGIEVITYSMSPLKQSTDYQALLEERIAELHAKRGVV
jgi:hypothetical protein